MKEPVCLRCGKCCVVCNGIGYAPCKYSKKNSCTIYEHRLGTETGPNGQHCGYRKDTRYDFEGCPYNTGKPILM